MQFGNDDGADPATCRGRAAQARLAADENTDPDFKRIFVRLAELYEERAEKLEADASRAKLIHLDAAEPNGN
jgi:hypothetical protein